MTPAAYIRRHVFGLTQAAMAAVAGTSQPNWSRYERDPERGPNAAQQRRIRAAAKRRGLAWNDSLFFQVPRKQAAARAASQKPESNLSPGGPR